MVVHRRVGVDLEQVSGSELPEVVFEELPVVVVAEDVLPIGAPVHQVMPSASGVVSWWSGHSTIMTMGCGSPKCHV